MKRIGIFSGTFDPVHKGHIAFALKAAEHAKLSHVYFLPEIKPRRKSGVTHIAHRVAMIELALKPHPKLSTLEFMDKQFTPFKTTARLTKRFPEDKLVLLLGSDALEHIDSWPGYEAMLRHMGVIVGVRAHSDTLEALAKVNSLPTPLRELHLIESDYPALSSREIRERLLKGKKSIDLLASLENYVSKNWLYSSIESADEQ